jgi:hypothetical protein
MTPRPRQDGTTPTTTPPVGPTPPTTVPVPPEVQAALAYVKEVLGLGGGGGRDVLGFEGQGEFQNGRLIPSTYTGPTKTVGGQPVQPQYFEGDEQSIATWDAEDVIAWQKRLAAGGYFSGQSYQPGIVRQSTLDAYKRALIDANQSFISVEQALERSKQFPYSGGGGSLRKYRMTAATDLQNVFDKVSQNVLGRTLDTEELDKLVKTYQGVELAGQKSQAGVAEAPPTAAAFAQKKIEAGNQDEADAVQFAGYAQTLERMLGG